MPDESLPKIEGVALHRRTGRGGMADVYLGIHETLQRRVAVKILHSHLVEERDVRRRFRAEAQAVSRLRHPNIVQVYDFGLLDGRPFIIMEFIEGPSLAGLLGPSGPNRPPFSFQRVAQLTAGIADALDYAHAQGIIHRDVKPANILLRPVSAGYRGSAQGEGRLEGILSDFGVARLAQSTAATLSGAILGTPAYMAPEQVTGESVDARTDIYSLGVVVYEMITGQLPFQAPQDAPAAMLFQHVHGEPPELPEALSRVQPVIDRALAKAPGERYPTAADLLDHLARAAPGIPSSTSSSSHGRITRPLESQEKWRMRRRSKAALLAIIGLVAMVAAVTVLPRILPGWTAAGQGTRASYTATATQESESTVGGQNATPASTDDPGRRSGSPTATLNNLLEVSTQATTLVGQSQASPTNSSSRAPQPTATQTTRPSSTVTAAPTERPSATPQSSPTPTEGILDPVLTLLPPLPDL